MNRTNNRFRQFFVIVGTAILMLVSSGSSADATTRAGNAPARVGHEFKLKARQQVTLKGEGLRIRFVEVESDSRCPANVVCVWAGTASVKVEVSLHGRTRKILTLSLMNNSAPVDYRNYKISLVGLSPYPRSDRKISPRAYEAMLLVTKN